MDYQHSIIEKKWQHFWAAHKTFQVSHISDKPKYYVLDMFPYPSGAGLHVGHPLGYIASDIYARYKRLKGFNVLHPMGYDSFGLPAEQYAIQTGQHPAITTETNINRYREQLDRMGFSFDWSREVRTSDPGYYRWTQWIFMQLFDSWYDQAIQKARPIADLISIFETSGSVGLQAASDDDVTPFSASEWLAFTAVQKEEELLKYRLAYLRESTVNWCAALGTVLANDEVINGVSERGGYPVEQKKMLQWSMRITAYADRLLEGLQHIDWPEPLIEMQRNWIGKSVGATVKFDVVGHDKKIEVFTTRVDTLYGVSFLVLAPEHEWVPMLTTPSQAVEIEQYLEDTKKKSELDRMSEVKKVTGVFTGSFALHPLTGDQVPIWVADYVLAGYGTGAVMAVPSGDQRDYVFAKTFDLPIIPISDAQQIDEAADPTKTGRYIHSELINGMTYEEAVPVIIAHLEAIGAGRSKVNFRLRDAIFGRQRYWGEPVPIYFEEGMPRLIEETELPLLLPEIDKYLPTETGEPPLGRAKDWKYKGAFEYELSTMPGWAGSSWYWYRYMDAQNNQTFASKEAISYWQDVDLYIGGSEHATGHLLYSRFWNKFLKDRGHVPMEEPFKKLINQGMIQGRSNFVYRVIDASGNATNTFVSHGLKDSYQTIPLHVDVNIVHNDILDLEKFKKFRPDFAEATFILDNGLYYCGTEVEKMSKSKYNVVNPDDIMVQYGADTLRMYEMFLGPLEQSKPWNTNGIEGVFKFLRKYWRLFHPNGSFAVSDEAPTKAELKALHKIIKKISDDIDRFSFNTSVSAFMICVNELTDLGCHKKAILEPLTVVLHSYAPHITEELWEKLGNQAGSISEANYPDFEPAHLIESEFNYPISINGKVRANLEMPLDWVAEEVESFVMAHPSLAHHLEGKSVKKFIFVKGRIVNMVI
jgi:leucyl-tRNA synthetase